MTEQPKPATPEVAAFVDALTGGEALRSPERKAAIVDDLRRVLRTLAPCDCAAVRNAVSETAEALDMAREHVRFMERRLVTARRLPAPP